MWVSPFIVAFLPQSFRIRTATPTRRLAVDIDSRAARNVTREEGFKQALGISPTVPIKAWEGIQFVESNGNYIEEAFLEEGPLYAKQHELPPLPVPKLKDTIDRFLASALPMAETDEEAESLKEACKEFASQAKFLQERLLVRNEECKLRNTSWLQEWWQKEVYLEARDPLNFFSSYYFLLHDPDTPAPPLWESAYGAGSVKAAALCRAAIDYADQVTTAQKAPDVSGKKKTPWCSSGYKYLFNACRIPKVGADSYRIYNPQTNRHVIIAHRRRFFEIPLQDQNGKIYSRAVLEDLISQVVEQPTPDNTLKLGWLTSWNRDEWAHTRKLLLKEGGSKMKKALERLEGALLVINLDIGTKAESLQHQAETFWHGGMAGGNRWWDKSIQLAVTEDGSWSYLGEHSMADGLLPVGFCQHLLDYGKDELEIPDGSESHFPDPEPKAVDVFENVLSSLPDTALQDVRSAVDKAKKSFSKHVEDLEIHVEHFQDYGSDFIKETGSSADAFAQMAMQLAAYRLFGKPVGTYESTQVRPFLHGRTETTRTVSPSSVAFAKAMGLKPNKNRTPEERHEMIKLLQDAAFHHVWYSKKAAMGQGIDRHFFGLSKMLGDDEEAPDLFNHPLFLRSKRWRLSTSTLPTCPGFGPAVDDGLGVGYNVYQNDIIFNISGRRDHGLVEKFGALLSEALEELKTLLDEE